VEGEASLEEAVLIIARYHLHISPVTLNLFGFRQVLLILQFYMLSFPSSLLQLWSCRKTIKNEKEILPAN
jgi:hypothetical protein